MASTTTTTNPEALVHIKISITGKDETRKFKLPPKDLGAAVLPDKLCALLQIPDKQDAVFERYSDSSASFVVLDSSNPSVYKQLQRAAKAKGKLRLRVSIKENPSPSVEEAPKVEAASARLSARRYVHPYVSDITNQDISLPSRPAPSDSIPKAEDSPLPTVFNEASPASTPKNLSPSEVREHLRQHFWPVTDSPAWSGATKSVFDKANKQNTQESLRKIKEAIAARAANPVAASAKAESDEAPVPRFFSARDHCRAEQVAPEPAEPNLRGHAESVTSCTTFTICCNNCDVQIPNAHWHCSICDDGDFDLCESCVQGGYLCDNERHWLIKRTVEEGKVVNSKTETIAPKKVAKEEVEKVVPGDFSKAEGYEGSSDLQRTCNSCVQVFDESQFVTCTDCEDFDLCIPCHVAQKHGHHPSHGFVPATPVTILTTTARNLLNPGRNVRHLAICDGCDKDINGVRHKCLKCPDWDYCKDCIETAELNHPGHRFVPVFEPMTNIQHTTQIHDGIYCDGPLCANKTCFIQGDRYKCAVCHDTDFCANCEAIPTQTHNRTHPLLKFKTPVRNVFVSTYGGKQDGSPMTAMGDYPQTSSKSTETVPPAPSANAATQVQTVAEVTPQNVTPVESSEKSESIKPADLASELNAHFVCDSVADGTAMISGAQFTQTWTLRNPGPHNWPVGCAVCFIGGDGMLDVDPNQPSHINHLRKATRSNMLDLEVAQGEEAQFTVTMRVPNREGKAISYWRLKAPDGKPFGHKLWCDISIQKPESATVKPEDQQSTSTESPKAVTEAQEHQSQLIFPKLDKDSLASSAAEQGTASSAPKPEDKPALDDVESLALDEDAPSSEDGFLTDEEYELIESGDDFEEAKNGKK